MTRVVLSFFVSGLVIVLGGFTSFVQSANFAQAAELDRLQREIDWNLRRTSELREVLERFAFDPSASETEPKEQDSEPEPTERKLRGFFMRGHE